ncbi:tetratricopeptide repeat protein [Luteolibacter arcticus]|uniref:Tetratricopeptide repeat protein n=1 Tax=Luteolibacter arcticus TaxID=1581411 RepID=A0ABT3GF64_9BACT|nr:tetratricopeptide repeat protein [Luteolibacter arcticus]MCW1922063.1 tetratricopeptide repeat protein [Luteolibacter arcticus]
MDSIPQDTSPAASRSGTWRIPALLLCIAAAFAAAYLQKKHDSVSDPSESKEVAQPAPIRTATDILAAIPRTDDGKATDQALAKCLATVSANPALADPWVSLGDILAQKQRDTSDPGYYAHAESAYMKALELDPRSVDAMGGLAWVTGGRHLFDKSIAWANQALEIDPGHIAATGIIGDAALELGDYEKAYEYYQKMMDLRPDLSSWSRGAYLLWLTGDKMNGTALMDRAIKAGAPYGENTAWCRARLAMMYFNDGALLPAQQVLAPALEKNPPNPHVVLAAARIEAAKENYPAAIALCERLLESEPHHEALVIAGDCQAAAGDAVAAEAYYARVEDFHAQQEAKGGHGHMQMARFYADHDRNLVVALRMAEEHKLTRNVVEADVLAWCYFKNGNLPRAKEVMKVALSQNTPDVEMEYHAGIIAAASGQPQSAKKHLRLALSRNAGFNPLQGPKARAALEKLSTGASMAAESDHPTPAEQ